MIMDQSVRKTLEQKGACREQDPAIFCTEEEPYYTKAKAICDVCPVRNECLNEMFFEAGVVVGGTTWKERKKLIAKGNVPDLPRVRLVESYARGGVRALMIEANQTEDEALKIQAALRLNERGSSGGRR